MQRVIGLCIGCRYGSYIDNEDINEEQKEWCNDQRQWMNKINSNKCEKYIDDRDKERIDNKEW